MAREAGRPRIILGPVLYFRGEQGDRWRVSALFVLDGETEPEDLRVDGVSLPVPPRHLTSWQGRHVWRFDFAVPRAEGETTVAYRFEDGGEWAFSVPGRCTPLAIAYASCNGVENEATLKAHPVPRNALWSEMLAVHRDRPFHLLLQGGDQVYADPVWHDCPTLARHRPGGRRGRGSDEPFTAAMAEEAMGFYFDLYLRAWGQPEVAAVLASVPSIMMWDDHDVFDGYGSLPDPVGQSPVTRGVALVARRRFALFQLGAVEERPPECVWGAAHGTFTQGFRLGACAILTPDLRSERTPDRVMSERTWALLPGWLERFAGGRHLLLMSSIPLLYVDTGLVERLAARLPFATGYEDDLRDQWRSWAHAAEWRRLLDLVTAHARRTGARVTSLSGEVHAGAQAVLDDGAGGELWQLIASGVVHPPPPRLYAATLEWLARRTEGPIDGWTLRLPPFPESGRRIIRQRNWLELRFDAEERLHAVWHAEGRPARYERVIAPPVSPA